eukprot:gb/GEZN01008077.1/.p1 GENE.gb/GEZN01008077.1/~~gb/GEZN01008077.1/.p1  ORF type:complete len:438 (-),score=49.43 gb/GEZN01008077.1/:155-1378(-)
MVVTLQRLVCKLLLPPDEPLPKSFAVRQQPVLQWSPERKEWTGPHRVLHTEGRPLLPYNALKLHVVVLRIKQSRVHNSYMQSPHVVDPLLSDQKLPQQFRFVWSNLIVTQETQADFVRRVAKAAPSLCVTLESEKKLPCVPAVPSECKLLPGLEISWVHRGCFDAQAGRAMHLTLPLLQGMLHETWISIPNLEGDEVLCQLRAEEPAHSQLDTDKNQKQTIMEEEEQEEEETEEREEGKDEEKTRGDVPANHPVPYLERLLGFKLLLVGLFVLIVSWSLGSHTWMLGFSSALPPALTEVTEPLTQLPNELKPTAQVRIEEGTTATVTVPYFDWTVERVAKWLQDEGLGVNVDAFLKAEVDGALLATLVVDDLLGEVVNSKLHQAKIKSKLQKLTQNSMRPAVSQVEL